MEPVTTADRHTPFFVLQYDMTVDLARQAGIDLWEFRLAKLKAKHPEWGTTRPLLILGAAALQILLAMAAVAWIGVWNAITQTLAVLGIIVIVILLYKASFYALPFLGRWLSGRQSVRLMRGLDHHRIEWRLYADRLETESAARRRCLAWTDVTRMSVQGQTLLLTLKEGIDLVMPVPLLTEETRQFLSDRIHHNDEVP